jgi:mono/diheme cytochrome c family protein
VTLRIPDEQGTFAEFQRVVRRGREGMPGYSAGQIGDAELQRMYDWLMALP